LGELATYAGIAIPADFKRHKGWSGQLLELWLGASAGSKPQQDFPELGVELKTLPISFQGLPLETTYVCYAPLLPPPGTNWQNSNVRNKLQHVLWVPIEGERSIPVAERRIATAFLWQPNKQQDHQLQQDWEELTELIALGAVESITARQGQVMQLRPKAASGKVLTSALGADGQRIQTRPRGFYLRKNFTRDLLLQAFDAPY
jgi:DNA mismatch repair protein MutH